MTIYRRGSRVVAAEEAIDEEGIVRDGYSVSVPLMFRDGTDVRRIRKEFRDSQLDEAAALADAGIGFHDGRGGLAGYRPGYCIPTDAELVRRRRAVQDAYEAAELADINAWRNPRPWAGAAALSAVPGLTADALA